MTREKDLFTSLETNDIPKETIVFGDNSKGEVIGLGKIALILLIIQLMMFIGLKIWDTICCSSHNFV